MKWFWFKPSMTVSPEPVIVGASEGKGELDVFSPTWVFIKQHVEAEIQRLRERNDSVILNVEQTAVLRGEIRALSRLAKLPEELTKQSRFTRDQE